MRSMFFLPRPTCALSQRLAKSGHHDTVSGLLTGSQGSPLDKSVSASSLAVRVSVSASSPVGDASLELAPASLSPFLPGVSPAVPPPSPHADSDDAVVADAPSALRRPHTRLRACAPESAEWSVGKGLS